MKAGKKGPMNKNFPSVFKQDNDYKKENRKRIEDLAKQGQPKGTKEALETMNEVGGNKRRRKNTYNVMMGQLDKVEPSKAVKFAKKISKNFN